MTTAALGMTIDELQRMKERAQPIVMVTAFDFASGRVAERAGVDIVLVGDSAAMTMLGYPSTREVSLDEMLMLTRAVRRGVTHPLLIGDMPFGTYETSDAIALASAKKFLDAGAACFTIEGAGPIHD